jgi:transposase-like protein
MKQGLPISFLCPELRESNNFFQVNITATEEAEFRTSVCASTFYVKITASESFWFCQSVGKPYY